MALGVLAIVIGAIFVFQAIEKNNWITTQMQLEKVTVGLTPQQIQSGEVVDNAAKAQAAADKIRADRRKIAPTYNDLLGGGKYDPTNLQQLKYTQALNMENSLNIAVLSFGVTTEILGTGAFMIITGLGLGLTGLVLFRLPVKAS